MISPSDKHKGFWYRFWHQLGRHPLAYMTGLYGICIVVFLIAVPLPRADGHLVGSDGIYYYAYLPTLLLDHDLDFTNQYAKLHSSATMKHRSAPTGRPSNRLAIGPAILWTPFFLIGHLLAIILKSAGYEISLDGIGYIYQIPTLLGSLTYGYIGILLIYRSCCRFFSRSSSAAAAILIWLATNVIYYMIAEPSMSHACSLFAVALFLDLWLAFRPTPKFHQWILLGLSGGLVALVRLQDSTCLALPVVDSLLALSIYAAADLRRQLKGFSLFILLVLVVFTPQMAVWHVLNGSAISATYTASPGYFRWQSPQILNVLFSWKHGLYLWHPVLLMATGGLMLLYGKDRVVSCLLAAAFGAQLWIIGAWFGWSGGHAFGGRLLIGSFPFLAFGLAALLEWSTERGGLPIAGIVASGLITWNALFFAQYRLGYISMNKAITFHQLTLGKFAMLGDLWERIKIMWQ